VKDIYWTDAAKLAAQFSPRSIVGPSDFYMYLENVPEFSTYEEFHDQFEPSLWVLHRGMSEMWPTQIRSQLLTRKFRIMAGNDVFSIITPCSTKISLWHLWTTSHARSLFSLLQKLKSRSSVSQQNSNHHGAGMSNLSVVSVQPASPSVDKYEVDRIVSSLADISGWQAPDQPNTSSTGELLRDLRLVKSNIKALAWRLEQLDSPEPLSATSIDEAFSISTQPFSLSSRICTSRDIYSDWHRALAAALRSENYKLRKIWEWTFTLKAFHASGKLNHLSHGLGFGCGTEPLASCLANYTQRLVVTDAPPELIHGKGWSDTNQHTSSLEGAKYEWLAPRQKMDEVMEFDFVDMNNIPPSLHNSFDLVWSSCALEHLGNKENGLEFIVNSALCLKPGGLAVHTTEFDLSGRCPIDNWDTVLFSNQDLTVSLLLKLRRLSEQPDGAKFELVCPDFRRGNAFIDGYVDIPPYSYHWNLNDSFLESDQTPCKSDPVINKYPYPQINLSVDGFPSTSVALVIRRLH
jgi:SAM-dependent methyltransferase